MHVVMKILVTGANGFLGKSIVRELIDSCKIKSLSRTAGDYRVALENEIPHFNQTFDLVIHTAGKAHSVPKTEAEKKQFHDINVLGTQNLLKGLQKEGVPQQFVFISSVAVYGQESGLGIDEGHRLDAKDAYGVSKIEAERLVQEWCKQHNVVCTILRLPLLVGKDAPGNLGAMIKAITKGYYFNIGGGKAKKSMVLARDVASAIMKVAPVGGIYNLTDGLHPDFNELSLAIATNKNKRKPSNLPMTAALFIGKIGDLLGGKAPIDSLKIKKMISDLTFDDTKAKITFDWKPQSVVEYINNNKI